MQEIEIQFSHLVVSLSRILDFISPSLVNHHMRVAYIAYCIAEKLGLTEDEQYKTLVAGAVHDIGALTQRERLHLLEFDYDVKNPHTHGYA